MHLSFVKRNFVLKDYAALEAEANRLAEQCREQQAFCEQQQGNNADAQKENMALAQQLSQTRLAYQETCDENLTLDSEVCHPLDETLGVLIAKFNLSILKSTKRTMSKLHVSRGVTIFFSYTV